MRVRRAGCRVDGGSGPPRSGGLIYRSKTTARRSRAPLARGPTETDSDGSGRAARVAPPPLPRGEAGQSGGRRSGVDVRAGCQPRVQSNDQRLSTGRLTGAGTLPGLRAGSPVPAAAGRGTGDEAPTAPEPAWNARDALARPDATIGARGRACGARGAGRSGPLCRSHPPAEELAEETEGGRPTTGKRGGRGRRGRRLFAEAPLTQPDYLLGSRRPLGVG